MTYPGRKPNEFIIRKQCIDHLETLHGDRLAAVERYLALAGTTPYTILDRSTAFLENALMVAQLNHDEKRFGDKYD